jgi:alpha-1,3-rhamnosyltransferase
VKEEKRLEKEYPLVTVCIPSYNHSKYVRDCIQSVVNQDYENIELIIIDDGSTDASVELIKKLEDDCTSRFKRFEIRSRPNKGLCATLNEALNWAKGEYFSPIASDDILLNHKISFLVERQKESQAAVVFGSMQRIDDANNILGSIIKKGQHNFEDMLFLKNMPQAPASLMLTQEIKLIGGFSKDVKLEDLYMWLALTNAGRKIISYPEIVVQYRDHEFNTVKNEKKMHDARLDVLNKFKSCKRYDLAIKNASLVAARSTASTEIIYPLIQLFKYKKIDGGSFFVFIKIITPNFLLKLIKSLMK